MTDRLLRNISYYRERERISIAKFYFA